jgi:hypothetical protein
MYNRWYLPVFIGAALAGCGPSLEPRINTITPGAICNLLPDRTFTITGAGFLGDGEPPKVTLAKVDDPSVVVTVPAAKIERCLDVNCLSLTVSVPKEQLPTGKYDVTIANDCGGVCTSSTSGSATQLDIVDVPQLSPLPPQTVCRENGVLTLHGSGLYTGGTVSIGRNRTQKLTTDPGGTTLTASFPSLLPPSALDKASGLPIPEDVTVRNAEGCESTLPSAAVVIPGPSLLFVDPPVAPQGYSFQVSLFVSGISGSAPQVQLAKTGTTNYQTLTAVIDPTHPNRLLVTVPGDLAAGTYDMVVRDLTGCAATMPGALQLSTVRNFTDNQVAPAFVSPLQTTSITISNLATATGERVFVAPSEPSQTKTATLLTSVHYASSLPVNTEVPKGLPPGKYDLLIVEPYAYNYSGIVRSAFTVTQPTEPPLFFSRTKPEALVAGTDTVFTILGGNFRAPLVTYSCRGLLGPTLSDGTAAVAFSAEDSAKVTLNAPLGSVACTVRVTNPDNGSYADTAAITVTSPLQTRPTFIKSGVDLSTARRAPAAVVVRTSQSQRFIYTIGGDRGADSLPLNTVDAALQDANLTMYRSYGVSQRLPVTLGFLGAVSIGRFIYTVGGFDGASAVRDVYRAQVLDPRDAPQISDWDFRYDPNQGLAQGQYGYRVSAVMQATDPNNPGGETLPSNTVTIRVPLAQGSRLQPVLTWPRVAGAQSYLVYRDTVSKTSSAPSGRLATVADNGMATQSYVDTGATSPASASPLGIGSTGAWKALPALNTARAGAGVVVIPDPIKPDTFYLYAVGGSRGIPSSPLPLSSVEYMTITTANGGTQHNVTGFTVAANSLPSARWLLSGMAATNAQNSNIPPGEAYLYAGSGITSSIAVGVQDKPVYVAKIGPGGEPGVFISSGSAGTSRIGGGSVLLNNQLMSFGGFQGSNPIALAERATLSAPLSLSDFTGAVGSMLTTARALQGTAVEGGFIYQVGGAGAGAAALTSVESAIW